MSGAHVESFANQIRMAAMALGKSGASFTVGELSKKAGLMTSKQEKKMSSSLCDFIRSGEMKRFSRGVYIYIGRQQKPLPVNDVMRNLLKIKKAVTVDDLQELGVGKEYAAQWLEILVRRGVMIKNANGRYELIAGMEIPGNKGKAARPRESREKKRAALAALETVMEKGTMMKILDNPTSYSPDERLMAARLAITFLDLLSVRDTTLKMKINQILERTPKNSATQLKSLGE